MQRLIMIQTGKSTSFLSYAPCPLSRCGERVNTAQLAFAYRQQQLNSLQCTAFLKWTAPILLPAAFKVRKSLQKD
eukprot:scaffold11582_cov18-Tisochrysis_lutea.AAC.1